jgi:WD40 repeat protein
MGVNAVAVLRSGRIVSGGSDGVLRIWDVASVGGPDIELGRPADQVNAITLLADGRVVSGGSDGVVRIWDPDHPSIKPEPRHREVNAVGLLANGRVVCGDSDGAVRVWNPARPSDRSINIGSHGGQVNAIAVGQLRERDVIVSGGTDGIVRMWNPATLRSPHGGELGRHDDWIFTRRPGHVLAVAILADGRVISGGTDALVRMWDPTHPDRPDIKLSRRYDEVKAVAVLDSGVVVTGVADGVVQLWDPARPGDPGTVLVRHDSAVKAIAATTGRQELVISVGEVTVFELILV